MPYHKMFISGFDFEEQNSKHKSKPKGKRNTKVFCTNCGKQFNYEAKICDRCIKGKIDKI
jgi:rRNA maturation endonuclease Nob1